MTSPTFVFANNATSTLLSAIAADDSTLSVQAGAGDALFPDPDYGTYDEWFAVTLTDPTSGAQEICYCTGRLVDVLTVYRGAEGTTALAWPAGTIVSVQLTAGVLNYLRDL